MLENYVPAFDATVVIKLLSQNSVILGKGNMDEFGMGSSCEYSAFHTTHNPWDITRVPGGSSGGGGAAVAADEVAYALGSDTGGSIRQPAAFNGVVGLNPTNGSVSRYGLIAYASAFDQIGPIAKDVTDCALIFDAIRGPDRMDATCVSRPYSTIATDLSDKSTASTPLNEGSPIRIGIPEEFFGPGISPGVKLALDAAIQQLQSLGASVETVSLPHTEHALACYYIIAPSEASANLSRYDGVKYGLGSLNANTSAQATESTRGAGFGDEVKRRILLGTYALSAGYYDAFYKKAQKVRTLIRREFTDSFLKFDVLVTPTSPNVAFKIGDKINDPFQMYMNDVCTIPVNIAGLPSISVPWGVSDRLPVGLQFIGPQFGDTTVIRAAAAYQRATNWHNNHPLI